MNLYAAEPIAFPDPATSPASAKDWLFVPVILEEKAVGVAARRPPPQSTEFIEVFACEQLAPKLGIKYHDLLAVRVLAGKYLSFAA